MDSSRKFMRYLGSLAATALISNVALGYTIQGGTIDVGNLDTYLSEVRLPNSGDATELDWVNSLVDPDTELTAKTNKVEYFLVDGESSIYAFNLQNTPEYFLIKNARNTALFLNHDTYDWGVFDLSLLELDKWNLGSQGKMTISHVTEFGNVPTAVPEPGSIALFGLGLVGMAAARRIQK